MYCITVFEDSRMIDLIYFDDLGEALDCKKEYTTDGYECRFYYC